MSCCCAVGLSDFIEVCVGHDVRRNEAGLGLPSATQWNGWECVLC